MESLTIPQLLTLLQSYPRPAADFRHAAQILQSKQGSLIDELTLKEVVIVEIQVRCQSLQRSLADQSEKLQQSETEIARVNRLYEDVCKRVIEFLTDGDRDGPLKKTGEELHKFDPQGVEYCRKLAFHYSGQLFSLYGNTKDSSTPS